MLIFPLSLGSRLFLIVLICLIFCYIVLIRVDVSVPSGAFLSLAGILLFLVRSVAYCSQSVITNQTISRNKFTYSAICRERIKGAFIIRVHLSSKLSDLIDNIPPDIRFVGGINVLFCLSVCPSITLVHRAEAVGENELSPGRNNHECCVVVDQRVQKKN